MSEINAGVSPRVTTLEKPDRFGFASAAAVDRQLVVDDGRILDRLRAMAEIGRSPQGGINRIAYSSADLQGRDHVMDLMRDAGLEIRIDAAGNIVGRREGWDAKLPVLLTGSHIDSVPEAGIYDGTVGVISAIEVAQVLAERKLLTRHPLEVIVFQNEEEGLFGSRAICGDLSDSDLDLPSQSGKTIREGIEYIGGKPDQLEMARRYPGEIAAYLEYHIEQGPALESDCIDIGIVEGIVGVSRWEVTIEGFSNHAGTTPMNGRKDALIVAAGFIEAVNRIIMNTAGLQVGTVGRIRALPGAPNVIPGKVILSLDVRDLESNKIEHLYQEISDEGKQLAMAVGASITFKQTSVQFPALTEPQVRQCIFDAAVELGVTSKVVRSGAGHDAQAIARIAPMGMIFIPSVGGISHTPMEYSRPTDIINGANVNLRTLLKLDAIL
ncbi:MAG: M20 family metallo-hydrolase [Acidobacteriota bacterium]